MSVENKIMILIINDSICNTYRSLYCCSLHTYAQIISTVGAVVIALGGAVLLSLMAESPIVGLEKLLLRPSKNACIVVPNFISVVSIYLAFP